MFTPSYLLLPVLLAASALAHPHPNTPRDVHHHQARNVTERDIISDLGHFTSARWTYYTPGLGACGAYSKESDYVSLSLLSECFKEGTEKLPKIVALNSAVRICEVLWEPFID